MHLFNFIFILALGSLASGASAPGKPFKDVLASRDDLSKFSNFLEEYPDIYGALSWAQDFTLLALSNDAMGRIDGTLLKEQFAKGDRDTIHAVLQYHVLAGNHNVVGLGPSFQFFDTWLIDPAYTNVTNGQKVGMVEQSEGVWIVTSGMGTRSTIVEENIQADNCLIHVIDNILVPPRGWIETAWAFNLTGTAGWFVDTSEDLDDLINGATDVTIFAPSNYALQQVGATLNTMDSDARNLTASYHALKGFVAYSPAWINGSIFRTVEGADLSMWFGSNKWFANTAQVIAQDILIDNGVIHVLDNVLSPNATTLQPNFTLPTQPPVIPSSMVSKVPFSSDAPASKTVQPTTSSHPVKSANGTTATHTGFHGHHKGDSEGIAALKPVAAGVPCIAAAVAGGAYLVL